MLKNILSNTRFTQERKSNHKNAEDRKRSVLWKSFKDVRVHIQIDIKDSSRGICLRNYENNVLEWHDE